MASDAVVNLVVNAAGADAQVNAQVRQIVNTAENRAPDINLSVVVNNSGLDGLDALFLRLDDRLADLDDSLGDLRDSLDRLGDNDSLRRIGDDADSADRSTSRLGSTFLSAAGGAARFALSLSSIVAAGSAAVPLIAGIASSLASVAPAAAAGVTGFVAIKAASATLKLALTGVQEAIAAVFDPDADPAALAEALERLSPNARAFVLELQKMKPAFDALRLDVQDRLFKDLDTDVSRLGKSVFPAARSAARDFADTFNDMARNAVGNARTLSSEGSLGKALGSSTKAFQNLERVPGQVLLAIGRLAAAGGPLLERFTEFIAEKFDGLTGKMTEAIDSGALEDAVNGAGDLLAQLGDVAENVGEILGNIFGAVTESGNGLFDTLELITEALADVTASTEFQETLSTLADLMRGLAEEIIPIVIEVLGILLPVIAELVTVLGDELLAIIPELGPLLVEVAGAFVAIVEAVIPLLPPLFDIIENILPLLIFFFRGTAEIITNIVAPALLVLVEGLSILIGWLNDMAGDTLRDFVIPIIQTFVDLLNGDMRSAQETAAQVTRRLVDSQVQAFTDFGKSVYNFAVRFAQDIVQGARNASIGFIRSVQDMLAGVRQYIGQIPQAARSALSGLNNYLRGAGQSMIRGFIDGMLSMLPSVRSAAEGLLSAARDYFPFSPARRGPFSGKGYSLFSGQKLAQDFAKGVTSGRGSVADALTKLFATTPATATDYLPAVRAQSGPTGALSSGVFGRTGQAINVYVGNELLTSFVDVRIDNNNQVRDRQSLQGVRA